MISELASSLLFYVFGAAALILAVMTVTARRLLRAAIYLMGVLVCSAAFYVMLQADFLAGIQILVYVGGIVILLVYAVMLTRASELQEDKPARGRQLISAAAAAGFFGITTTILLGTNVHRMDGHAPASTASEIGRRLLDQGPAGYVLPFEVISLLLLCVLIGGIVIARKGHTPAILSKES